MVVKKDKVRWVGFGLDMLSHYDEMDSLLASISTYTNNWLVTLGVEKLTRFILAHSSFELGFIMFYFYGIYKI